jgi:hypothetical protein
VIEEWERRIREAQTPDEMVEVGAEIKATFDRLVGLAKQRRDEMRAEQLVQQDETQEAQS